MNITTYLTGRASIGLAGVIFTASTGTIKNFNVNAHHYGVTNGAIGLIKTQSGSLSIEDVVFKLYYYNNN